MNTPGIKQQNLQNGVNFDSNAPLTGSTPGNCYTSWFSVEIDQYHRNTALRALQIRRYSKCELTTRTQRGLSTGGYLVEKVSGTAWCAGHPCGCSLFAARNSCLWIQSSRPAKAATQLFWGHSKAAKATVHDLAFSSTGSLITPILLGLPD